VTRPEGAFSAQVVGYWPDLSETDPDEQYRLDKAIAAISTNRDVPAAAVLTHAQRGVKPRLRICCAPERHRSPTGTAPGLAEVWDTAWGVLFAAPLGGAAGDVVEMPAGKPFDPPLALRPRGVRRSVDRRQATQGEGWKPVPITVVRVFLPPPDGCRLWVKCTVCGPGEVDWVKIGVHYELDQRKRRRHDSATPSVVSLHSVGALYS
jgi:hypothetical protein